MQLPPSVADFVKPKHLALFVRDLVQRDLDPSSIERAYRLRKITVEPVFGQIKERRGFRRFSLRGLSKVRCERRLACAAHNLVKLAAWSRRGAAAR